MSNLLQYLTGEAGLPPLSYNYTSLVGGNPQCCVWHWGSSVSRGSEWLRRKARRSGAPTGIGFDSRLLHYLKWVLTIPAWRRSENHDLQSLHWNWWYEWALVYRLPRFW